MLCPDCKNQYDTCITCNGMGHVDPHDFPELARVVTNNPPPNGLDDRVRYKVRRDGNQVFLDLWFDECSLGSRVIVGGDLNIALMVESGELRLTKDSKLVFEDGEPYQHPKRPYTQGPHTIKSGYQKV